MNSDARKAAIAAKIDALEGKALAWIRLPLAWPRWAALAILVLGILIGLGLAGGIKGHELKPAPVGMIHAQQPVEPADPAPLPLLAVVPIGIPIMKYFAYAHLPEKLQQVSKPVRDLAEQMAIKLPDCAEKSAGLRKLLEAKDCFVRAALEEHRT